MFQNFFEDTQYFFLTKGEAFKFLFYVQNHLQSIEISDRCFVELFSYWVIYFTSQIIIKPLPVLTMSRWEIITDGGKINETESTGFTRVNVWSITQPCTIGTILYNTTAFRDVVTTLLLRLPLLYCVGRQTRYANWQFKLTCVTLMLSLDRSLYTCDWECELENVFSADDFRKDCILFLIAI